jgi:hypothetical protein
MIEVLTKLIKTRTMLKSILKLEGAQKLTKNEQKSIKGGLACTDGGKCPAGTHCVTSGDFEGLCRRN